MNDQQKLEFLYVYEMLHSKRGNVYKCTSVNLHVSSDYFDPQNLT